MKKIKINDDCEWYPVICISNHGTEVEVDEETYNRWVKVFNEFKTVQKEMKDIVNIVIYKQGREQWESRKKF